MFLRCFVAFLLLCFSAASPGEAKKMAVIADGEIGCRGRESFDRLSRLAAQGDKEAFLSESFKLVSVGECRVFRRGQVVFLADVSMLSGLVKVRPKGLASEFWVDHGAVR